MSDNIADLAAAMSAAAPAIEAAIAERDRLRAENARLREALAAAAESLEAAATCFRPDSDTRATMKEHAASARAALLAAGAWVP